MALATRTTWEVRSGGSSTNGGGFNPANVTAGTDYSQQTSPQITYSDLVIDGAVNTHITSAAHPFDSTTCGNIINITGGTGFTTGRFEIVSVSGVTATVDRSMGTLASTGGAGKLGGALASPATVDGVLVGGMIVYINGGTTYTPAATISLTASGSDGAPISFIGYATTRGDNGQATFQWTGAGGGNPLSLAGTNLVIRGLTADGNAFTADTGLLASGGTTTLVNCHAKNCKISGITINNQFILAYRCSATNNGVAGTAGSGGFTVGGSSLCHSCVSYSNVGNGFMCSNVQARFFACIARGNTKSGFYSFGSGGTSLYNCTTYGNTLDGLRLDGSPESQILELFNTIFAGNTGYGINSTTTDYTVTINAQQPLARNWNSAFYSNTAGNRFQWPAGAGDIILTADPFTSVSTFDFSLNGMTGGGASLRGAGVPGGLGLISTADASAGHADVGAVQTLGAAPASTTVQSLRSLWRELTGEQDTTVIPDATVDIYVQAGLEALNRFVGYHMTTDTTTVVFVNGTQEYSIPADCLEMLWIEYNNKLLDKTSAEEWQRQGVNWRGAKRGMPTEWAIYANKLIFYPTPDAATVNTAASPTLRYVSTPPSFTTNGPDQLASQDWRIAVYYGVAEFSRSYPDSAFAAKRADDYQQKFDVASQGVSLNYKKREVQQ